MDISVAKINSQQAAKVIGIEESHFEDVKSIDIAPSKLTKSISAFANASGGELYIGIDENTVDSEKIRAWRGFGNQEDANGHLQIFEQLFPLGQYYSYSFLACDGHPGLVLQVNINKSRTITKASNGTPYLRRGAASYPVADEEAMKRLRLDKGIESFETETVQVDIEAVTNSTPHHPVFARRHPHRRAGTLAEKAGTD